MRSKRMLCRDTNKRWRSNFGRTCESAMLPALFSTNDRPEWGFSGERDPQHSFGRERSTGYILLIEDNSDLRETLEDILRYEGYNVVALGNGGDALIHIKSHPLPTLILLDLMMPVMSGWEFRSLQLRDPALASVPVVIISGTGDVRQQAILLNVTEYLAKPIEVARLLEVVRRHCG